MTRLSNNKVWGFYGSIRRQPADAEQAWPLAMHAITTGLGWWATARSKPRSVSLRRFQILLLLALALTTQLGQ